MNKPTKTAPATPSETDVLRRMLSAPPKPHAPKPAKKAMKKPAK